MTVHYIPHLAAIRKEAKTTKLRVVYDASAKSNKTSVSLNECLLKGTSLDPLLFHILLRFREKRTALVGDIEKAFLSIEVNEADRNLLRFLWLENPKDPNSKIIMYRFCRVVFGLNASPFLLNATLRHHISKYNSIDLEFVRKLLDSFYVDDLVTGEDDSNEAYELFGKARERMANAGFRLRKRLTNDKDLRDKILAIENFSAKDTTSESKHMLAADSDESYAKQTLGIGSKLNSGHEKVWWPDILPKDTLPKDTLPKDILPNGHFADGHLVERTFCRTDSMTSGLFAEKTFCRNDNLPKIEKF